MITHEIHNTRLRWYQVILWDFLVPLGGVAFVAWFLDRWLARLLLQHLVDLPWVGGFIYRSPFFPWFVKWHYLVFLLPLLLALVSISFKTARIPGPGRAFLRWWQGLLQLKVRKEEFVEPFPPAFDRKSPAVSRLRSELNLNDPHTRVLGFFKRFVSDIEQDRREGKEPEKPADYSLIILPEELRYRHIQVIGGSGSGKSASIIAPMLIDDAVSPRLATLTINPKADLFLIKVMVDGIRRRKKLNPSDRMPTAVLSFSRKDSLAYDPLLYGDADALTKKIMGSSEITHPFYKSFQETWLMSFFRVVKTEPLLIDRVMLRHLYHYLTKPVALLDEIRPLCRSEHNLRRLGVLAAAKPESLAGVASHISQLVEDESLTHIFDNPEGRMLNLREIIRRGGNIFIEVDTSSKGPQGRALGRMIMMEVQLLAGARQAGFEPKEVGLQVFLDEFASFAYNGFIDLIDKCRSARVGLLLAHQSLGNLQRDNLSKSFKDEIVDNTYTKFFLSLKDETAEWASRQLGTRKVVKKSLSIGHATEQTDTGARENRTLTFREEFEPYVQPSDFNLEVGYGFANLENRAGRLVKGPIRVGYVDEKDLCTDEELYGFLREAIQDHPRRPRNGSLIDNDIAPGEPEGPVAAAIPMMESDLSPSDPNVDSRALSANPSPKPNPRHGGAGGEAGPKRPREWDGLVGERDY